METIRSKKFVCGVNYTQTAENIEKLLKKYASAVSWIKCNLNINGFSKKRSFFHLRKEYVEPDLNINDLWKVYFWDEKWIQLQNRKENLVRLFEKMQSYQADQILADPDKPLGKSITSIASSPIDRLIRSLTWSNF